MASEYKMKFDTKKHVKIVKIGVHDVVVQWEVTRATWVSKGGKVKRCDEVDIRIVSMEDGQRVWSFYGRASAEKMARQLWALADVFTKLAEAAEKLPLWEKEQLPKRKEKEPVLLTEAVRMEDEE